MDTKLIQVWFHSQRERRTTKTRQDPPRQGSNYVLSLHGCEPKSAARKNEKCLKNLQLDITHWVLRILCNHCSMWYKKLVGVWICPFFPLSTTKVSGQAITRTKRPNKKPVQTKFTYVHLQCNSLQSQRNNKTCMYPSSCWTCCFSCCDRSRPKDGFALALDTWCSFYSLHRWVTQSSNTFILAVLSWGKVGGKTEDRNWNHKSPHLPTDMASTNEWVFEKSQCALFGLSQLWKLQPAFTNNAASLDLNVQTTYTFTQQPFSTAWSRSATVSTHEKQWLLQGLHLVQLCISAAAYFWSRSKSCHASSARVSSFFAVLTGIDWGFGAWVCSGRLNHSGKATSQHVSLSLSNSFHATQITRIPLCGSPPSLSRHPSAFACATIACARPR